MFSVLLLYFKKKNGNKPTFKHNKIYIQNSFLKVTTVYVKYIYEEKEGNKKYIVFKCHR